MTQQKHTPTPWSLIDTGAWWEGAKDRGLIFKCALIVGTHIPIEQNKTNAEFIVHVVNSYEGLIAENAVKSAVINQLSEQVEELRAVIAKTEGR